MTEGLPTFSPSAINILVAEDDPQMRSIVADALRKDGYVVDPVGDGGEVMLRIIDSYRVTRTMPRIDLVVTDVRMPVSSGLGLVESMRKAGWTIPVVIMTAFGDAETCERAQSLGATLLDKPFKMGELRQRVRDLLVWAHLSAQQTAPS
jgi:DNA-binding response OmpR family regulator